MRLVSLSQSLDPDTAKTIMNIAQDFNLEGFWSGGYVSHPIDERVINTVVWSSTTMETEIVAPGDGYFSKTGETNAPQPDNFAFVASGGTDRAKEEHCVAVLNNRYNDGIALHDLTCDVRLPVVCQEIDFGIMSPETLLLP